VGKYTCHTKNSEGEDSKTIFVSIMYAPTVEVHPKVLKLKLGEITKLNCRVKNASAACKIRWIDDRNPIGVATVKVKKSFKICRRHIDSDKYSVGLNFILKGKCGK
jgi:hypothetical protein